MLCISMRTLLLFGGTVMDNQLMQFDIVGLHGVRDYSILFFSKTTKLLLSVKMVRVRLRFSR